MNRDYSYPLRVSADRYPDRVALAFRAETWTFADLDAAADRLARAFTRRGLGGQPVVLLLQNEPLTVIAYLALARAGAIAVPVNPRLRRNEIAFVVDDCGAAAIIADGAFADDATELLATCATAQSLLTVNDSVDGHERIEDLVAEPIPQDAPPTVVDPQSVALIVYTSGTSGVPKGVTRTHDANLWTSLNAMLGQLRQVDDVEVFVLPLFGIAFIFQVMPMILGGGTTVLDGTFDPARTWELLERHRATRVFLAPTMIDSMLSVEGHERRDLSALRIVNTAYEFPERVRLAATQRFGEILAYMYGLTEAQLCCSTPAQFAADPTDAGHPMGMMRIRVVDENREPVPAGVVGEIAMEGPSLMNGYHGRAQDTAETLAGGWLYTGDLGYLDDAGRVHVAGRKKAMIKTGGFSVDPVEVENAMLAFPGVREAAVVGIPDEHWGEQVVGFVAAEAGAEVDEADLLRFVKQRIATFKSPKRLWFVPELPKNASGKVERARLRTVATENVQLARQEAEGAGAIQS
jgi:acyl-CoA synthetase (AMP-forming)/AMP-acid ligase II